MAIAPGGLNAIAAGRGERGEFVHARRKHRELGRRIEGSKNSFTFAGGAWALRAQIIERIAGDVPIVPRHH